MNARSPLIPELEPDAALKRLIETGLAMTGFLKGEAGGSLPGWHAMGRDNGVVLDRLHQALAERYPDAGQPFWAVRVWTSITWQPAYLAVIAVHILGTLPDLNSLSQKAQGIHIDGYRLQPSVHRTGLTMDLIDIAGAELRAMADAMLAEINAITRLKPTPARRLLVDRMLGLMVRLARMRLDLPAATIRAFCDRWLAAMGLTGQGNLETLLLPDGREVVISARKGCCLDYLIEPGDFCATCPKQPHDIRRARQRG